MILSEVFMITPTNQNMYAGESDLSMKEIVHMKCFTALWLHELISEIISILPKVILYSESEPFLE